MFVAIMPIRLPVSYHVEEDESSSYSPEPDIPVVDFQETDKVSAKNRSKHSEGYKYVTGAKLGRYDGTSCLDTFLAKFKNCAEFFQWTKAEQLFS